MGLRTFSPFIASVRRWSGLGWAGASCVEEGYIDERVMNAHMPKNIYACVSTDVSDQAFPRRTQYGDVACANGSAVCTGEWVWCPHRECRDAMHGRGRTRRRGSRPRSLSTSCTVGDRLSARSMLAEYARWGWVLVCGDGFVDNGVKDGCWLCVGVGCDGTRWDVTFAWSTWHFVFVERAVGWMAGSRCAVGALLHLRTQRFPLANDSST